MVACFEMKALLVTVLDVDTHIYIAWLVTLSWSDVLNVDIDGLLSN